jgi:hypothetical protein
MKDKDYCDHCGKVIPAGRAYAIARLPVDIDSANAGESAILCGDCYLLLKIEGSADMADGDKS